MKSPRFDKEKIKAEIERMFRGRINRRDLIVGFVAFLVLKFIACIPTYIVFLSQYPLRALVSPSSAEFVFSVAHAFSIFSPEGVLYYLLTLIVVLWSMGMYARRFHDLGWSGRFSVLILLDFLVQRIFTYVNLPYISYHSAVGSGLVYFYLETPQIFTFCVTVLTIYLLCKKGQDSSNKYGDIPPAKSRLEHILLGK